MIVKKDLAIFGSITALVLLLVLFSGCDILGEEPTGSMRIITDEDYTPSEIYMSDPKFSFTVYFEGTIYTALDDFTINYDVIDSSGLVFREGSFPSQVSESNAIINVTVPRDYPDLPVPGDLTMRVWEGGSYEASTMRDSHTVVFNDNDLLAPEETSYGGETLTKGEPMDNTQLGVGPSYDPDFAGTFFIDNVDINIITGAEANDTVSIDFFLLDYADVYLRDAVSFEFIDTADTTGDITLTIPEDGNYYVYVVYNEDGSSSDNVKYGITWN
jgi:hypothetical protein